MKESLLTILRNKETTLSDFRAATKKLSSLMASEIAKSLKQEKVLVKTTLASAQGYFLKEEVVLVPILRSGMALLPEFAYFFDRATIGFLGMKRNEETKKPFLYYENLPPINENKKILVLDPMIATGGSSTLALKILKEKGAFEKNLHLVGIIAALDGLQKVKKAFPKAHVHTVAVDKKLNKSKFIVPGLGDFGDRFFGTL